MMSAKGFTLIEVILVIVIMAIAIPGLISAVSFMTQSQVNTIGTTTAMDLAQERMEQIVADKMNPLVGMGYGYIISGNYLPDTPMTGYNRSVNIICVLPADLNTGVPCDTGYKRVQVTVQAVGVGPSVPNAVLVTLVTNY